VPIGTSNAVLPPTGHYYILGVSGDPNAGSDPLLEGVLNAWNDIAPSYAQAIDAKIDDGRPLTGAVEVLNGGNGNNDGMTVILADPAPGGCATATMTYSMSSAPLCTLAIRAKF
jgi:predicted aconitase with swiveling domain